jgi:hypothetical protein
VIRAPNADGWIAILLLLGADNNSYSLINEAKRKKKMLEDNATENKKRKTL